MKKTRNLAAASIFLAGLTATSAGSAHTLGAHGGGFAEGCLHPLLGLDHLLAMLAVGLWAAQLGGSARWRVPLAFLAIMGTSAWWAQAGFSSFPAEAVIAASVLVLGLLVAFRVRVGALWSLLWVAGFAAGHGYAHGRELMQAATPWDYAAGFLLATAGLHGLGLGLGFGLKRQGALLRSGGAAIAMVGLWLMASA